ncbi:MAG: hypothetical protein JNM61_01640 [Zoogloeaceae bacterium]|nr:hypothetical protein [Zoogloeaceae bacterium]
MSRAQFLSNLKPSATPGSEVIHLANLAQGYSGSRRAKPVRDRQSLGLRAAEFVERDVDGTPCTFSAAITDSQIANARRLVEKRYAWRGYDTDGVTRAPLAAGERTFVAESAFRMEGTLTVRLDDQVALFAEELYPTEIGWLRRSGARLCEFGRLAFEEGVNTLEVLGPLFHLAMKHAMETSHATDMVIEVNPRHAGFYQRIFGFTVLGEEKTCERVSAPAVLLHLDLTRAAQKAEADGGTRSGRRSIYPYCLASDELATGDQPWPLPPAGGQQVVLGRKVIWAASARQDRSAPRLAAAA